MKIAVAGSWRRSDGDEWGLLDGARFGQAPHAIGAELQVGLLY